MRFKQRQSDDHARTRTVKRARQLTETEISNYGQLVGIMCAESGWWHYANRLEHPLCGWGGGGGSNHANIRSPCRPQVCGLWEPVVFAIVVLALIILLQYNQLASCDSQEIVLADDQMVLSIRASRFRKVVTQVVWTSLLHQHFLDVDSGFVDVRIKVSPIPKDPSWIYTFIRVRLYAGTCVFYGPPFFFVHQTVAN